MTNLALVAMALTKTQAKTLRQLVGPPTNWWIPPATRRVLVRKGLIAIFTGGPGGRGDGVQITDLGRQAIAIFDAAPGSAGMIVDSGGRVICAAEERPDGTIVPTDDAPEVPVGQIARRSKSS